MRLLKSDVRNANHPYLSDDEIKRLIRRSQAGDQAAREKLVNCNIRLVWSVVQRFLNRGYEADDLFQIGCHRAVESGG